jgi:hypothetical protein
MTEPNGDGLPKRSQVAAGELQPEASGLRNLQRDGLIESVAAKGTEHESRIVRNRDGRKERKRVLGVYETLVHDSHGGCGLRRSTRGEESDEQEPARGADDGT